MARLFKNDLDYLTRAERSTFARNRARGLTTFFQTAACAQCGAEIPKTGNKKYCQQKCSDAAKEGDNHAEAEQE
jgi:predicted amidophosphoribosyltransferase